jgi:hypothetical protein
MLKDFSVAVAHSQLGQDDAQPIQITLIDPSSLPGFLPSLETHSFRFPAFLRGSNEEEPVFGRFLVFAIVRDALRLPIKFVPELGILICLCGERVP